MTSSDRGKESQSLISLQVTEEQKQAIRELFAREQWEYIEIENNEISENIENTVEQHTIDHDPNSDECEYCLCRPCITDERNRQSWWENESHAPHKRNSALRKDKYKRFWTNLFHRRVWSDPRYLLRKQNALLRDRQDDDVYHRRDLLPKCVIKIVRGWLPNASGKAYMGHKWD